MQVSILYQIDIIPGVARRIRIEPPRPTTGFTQALQNARSHATKPPSNITRNFWLHPLDARGTVRSAPAATAPATTSATPTAAAAPIARPAVARTPTARTAVAREVASARVIPAPPRSTPTPAGTGLADREDDTHDCPHAEQAHHQQEEESQHQVHQSTVPTNTTAASANPAAGPAGDAATKPTAANGREGSHRPGQRG